jgi:hypothetical protein
MTSRTIGEPVYVSCRPRASCRWSSPWSFTIARAFVEWIFKEVFPRLDVPRRDRGEALDEVFDA